MNLLIVDDDSQFLNSIKDFLQKNSYYEIFTAENSKEAEELLSKHDFEVLIVDCLLPAESGIDFLKNTRKKFLENRQVVTILISGIFTDHHFINQAIQETGANHFLEKPLDFNKLLKLFPNIDSEISNSGSKVKNRLYSFLSHKIRNQRTMQKIFEEIEWVNGFDLPLILNLIMDLKISGFLNLQNSNNQIFGVTFSLGKIVSVDIHDKKTLLGNLLVEYGFILPSDLDLAFVKNDEKMKFGERLVKQQLVSPHALDIVMSEQMSLRLSSIILNEEYKFNFVSHDVEDRRPYIDHILFNQYLHDWINAKFDLMRIKTQLIQWDWAIISKVESAEKIFDEIKDFPLIVNYFDLCKDILSEKSLVELLKKYQNEEEILLKQLYFLLIKGIVYFNQKDISEISFKLDQINDLESLLQSKEPLKEIANYFMIESEEIDLIINFLKNFLNPFLQSKNLDLRKRAQLIMKKLSSLTKDSNNQVQDKNEKSLQALKMFEDGKNFLKQNRYKDAFNHFQKALELESGIPKLRIYYVWSIILMGFTSAQKEKFITLLDKEMLKIDPQDKHDSLYFHIQGLIHKIKGNNLQAIKFFEKAISLEPEFIHSKRELIILKKDLAATQKASNQGILDKDLKSLIGQLFKKRAN